MRAAVCAEYGITLAAAHNASADALAAARLAGAIAERHPKIAALGPAELHRRQVEWYAEWAADFQKLSNGRNVIIRRLRVGAGGGPGGRRDGGRGRGVFAAR